MSKKNMECEYVKRSYSFDVAVEESENGAVITGRPIVYNSRTNLGLFDEIINRGALNATDLQDVRFLINHNKNMIPLARSRNNNENSTMKLIPNYDGLDIRVNLDIEGNSDARALYSAVKRGDITGMSFMFSVPKGGDKWDGLNGDHPIRSINAIKSVVEVSAVTFPAYEDTEINARDTQLALDSARAALDSADNSLDSEEKRLLDLEKAKNENRMKGGI